jgi:hypothetical protein
MKRTGRLFVSLVLAAAGSACAPDESGSAAQPSAVPDPVIVSDAPSASTPEVPPVVPTEAAADPTPATAPAAEVAAPEPAPAPAEPFNVETAATVLDQPLDRAQETIDEHTVEYTLAGSTSSALIAQTQWSTAPEAEFECERAAVGAERIVGSDRILYVAPAGVWLAQGSTCTRLSVTANSAYSASLTESFAQGVFGAPSH